jgi:hypothetical protein
VLDVWRPIRRNGHEPSPTGLTVCPKVQAARRNPDAGVYRALAR